VARNHSRSLMGMCGFVSVYIDSYTQQYKEGKYRTLVLKQFKFVFVLRHSYLVTSLKQENRSGRDKQAN
jgi:hypothetical protein